MECSNGVWLFRNLDILIDEGVQAARRKGDGKREDRLMERKRLLIGKTHSKRSLTLMSMIAYSSSPDSSMKLMAILPVWQSKSRVSMMVTVQTALRETRIE